MIAMQPMLSRYITFVAIDRIHLMRSNLYRYANFVLLLDIVENRLVVYLN